jgi:hypothetical protein
MTTLPILPILNIQLTTNITNLAEPTQPTQSFRFNPSMLGSRAPSKNRKHNVYVPTNVTLTSPTQFGKDKLSIILSKILFNNEISLMPKTLDETENAENIRKNIPIILEILFEPNKLFTYKNKDYTIKNYTWDGNWVAISENGEYIDINVSLDLAADKPARKLNIRSSCEERATHIERIFNNLTNPNLEIIPLEAIPLEAVASEVIPSEVIPSEVIPSEVIPSEALASEVLPSAPPQEAVPVSSSGGRSKKRFRKKTQMSKKLILDKRKRKTKRKTKTIRKTKTKTIRKTKTKPKRKRKTKY